MAAPTPALQGALQNARSRKKPAQSFDLRFNLTEAEWREASALLHPIVGDAYTKPWIRLFCAFFAVMNLIAPMLHGSSWSELILHAPHRAALASLGVLICGFGATRFGTKWLDHRLNRLDLERHVIMTEDSVTVTWNDHTWNHQWTDFVYFRESANVLILRNPDIRFWTIPLRAIPVERQPEFRQLVGSKLARRQPYSWSPDN